MCANAIGSLSISWPKITIITINLNQAEYLEETIASVLSQGYPNLEYILIDGGSTDNSDKIIKRYTGQLAYWCSEPDKGHYDAVNKGMSRATGDVLAFLNSDDKYFPGALHAVGEVFATQPDVAWLTSLMPAALDASGHVIDIMRQSGYSREALLDGRYGGTKSSSGTDFIQQESTFWRRSLWDKVGGRIRDEISHAADFDLWCRFYAHAELCGIVSLLGAFRLRAGQRSQDVVYTAQRRELLHQARKNMAWCPQPLRIAAWRSRLAQAPKIGKRLRQMMGYPASRLIRRNADQRDAFWEIEKYKFL